MGNRTKHIGIFMSPEYKSMLQALNAGSDYIRRVAHRPYRPAPDIYAPCKEKRSHVIRCTEIEAAALYVKAAESRVSLSRLVRDAIYWDYMAMLEFARMA